MLSSKIQTCLSEYDIDLRGKNLLCCVSGGADSMAMLHYLYSNMGMLGLNGIYACHYNHSMRGAESLRDERVVTDFCSRYSIPVICDRLESHFDIDHIDHSENTLRTLRYQFFENAAESCKADLIATAHNLNDNVETILFRIARGTGLRGMSGIPAVRGKYVRPLLYAKRYEIEEYCKSNEIPFITDSSNLKDEYRRNLIRHKVIPVLNNISENYLEAILSLSHLSNDADRYFTEEALSLLESSNIKNGVNRKYLNESRSPLDSYIVLNLFYSCGISVSSDTIKRCLELVRTKGKLEVSSNVYFIVDDDKCWIERKYEAAGFGPLPYDKLETLFKEKRFMFLERVELDTEAIHKLFYSCVDYDKLYGVPQFRSRRNGDYFSSAYRNNTKSLKKLFNEKKYSAQERDRLVLLTDDSGIVWLEGEGPARGKEIDINTKRVIRFFDFSKEGEQNA